MPQVLDPNFGKSSFYASVNTRLLRDLLDEITESSYIFNCEASERSLVRDGFSKEIVMHHYVLIHEQKWVEGFVDPNQQGPRIWRLTFEGYRILRALRSNIDILAYY